MKKKLSPGSRAYLFFVYLVLYVPIMILIAFSFNDSKINATWQGFTFKWYAELLKDQTIIEAMKNSLLIAIISTIIAVMLGTLTAFAMYKHKFKGKSVVDNVMFITIVVPEIVLGIALLVLFSNLSKSIPLFSNGYITLIISHITFSISYVYFVVKGRLDSFDKNLEEAAMDLGCTPIQTFFKVTLQVISPGIISGALLAFTLSLDDVIISFFVSGPDITTLPLKVFSMVKLGVSPVINALSTILLVITLIIVFLTESIQRNKYNKKKTYALSGILLALVVFIGGGIVSLSKNNATTSKESINIFNWSEYIPNDVISDFEKEFNVKVNYATFSSNEEMFSKVSTNPSQYDIVIASDYMVEKLKSNDIIEKLNYENIPNYKNISENYKSLKFDPNNEYTIPYMWNQLCIVVNTKLVDFEVTSFKDLWRSEFRNSLVVLNDQRAMVGMALKKNGYSINDVSDEALNIAEKDLLKLKANIKLYDSDSPKTALINGEVKAGYTWGPEIALAQRDNKDIIAVLPEEGLILQQDNFVKIKGTKKSKQIDQFINYILRPEISARISEKFPYGNPNEAAFEYLDENIKENIAIYPPEELYKAGEYFRYIGNETKKITNIWNNLKR